MRYLFDDWEKIEALVRDHYLALFLDYDGTLTPIVEHPRLAKLSRQGKTILRKLVKTEEVSVSIVSGRSLSEIQRRIGISGCSYAGNHGLEFQGPSLRFVHPEALATKKIMKRVEILLARHLKRFRGLFLENKGITVTVHYRGLRPEKVDEAKSIFTKIIRPYLMSSKLVVNEGKKIWEVRPPTYWNKGTMALWFLARVMAKVSRKEVLPVYIGDDQTDEDAFRTLKKGIGIKVSEDSTQESEASYFLRSPREVLDFLKKIIAIKKKKGNVYAAV